MTEKKQRNHSTEIITEGKAALSVKEAAYFIGLSKCTFWTLRREDPTFPKPIVVSKFPKFLKSELLDWLHSKKEEV